MAIRAVFVAASHAPVGAGPTVSLMIGVGNADFARRNASGNNGGWPGGLMLSNCSEVTRWRWRSGCTRIRCDEAIGVEGDPQEVVRCEADLADSLAQNLWLLPDEPAGELSTSNGRSACA